MFNHHHQDYGGKMFILGTEILIIGKTFSSYQDPFMLLVENASNSVKGKVYGLKMCWIMKIINFQHRKPQGK